MMEYDTRKEARVWQRVQGDKQEAKNPPPRENLQALIAEQLQLSAAYLQMSRQVNGREGAIYMRLAREAKAQAVCMKGILTLTTGQVSAIGPSPVQASPWDVMLRRCYGQELRLLTEYENRRSDPEYGPVFERLSGRGREHCCILLELIGSSGKK